MKYLFILSEKFYMLIKWELHFLKKLGSKKKENALLRVCFALLFLLSILSILILPPFFLGILFGEGLKFSIFFLWIWILNLKFF